MTVTVPQVELLRIQFLARVVQKEIDHLRLTDQRLFNVPFTDKKAGSLQQDVELAERVEAFVSRFGRLQDTVGDKLLPRYLDLVGETVGPAVDNLNRAEKLGLITSADVWMGLRRLRNQMVHDYMENLDALASALNKGHQHVVTLTEDADRILADLDSRGWLD